MSTVQEIDVDTLAERLAEGGVTLFDVREPGEYDEAHVPGAVLVPLGTVPDNVAQFADAAAASAVLVVCRSGARSMRACEFLAENGVVATNVAGGTLAWLASGRVHATGEAAG